MPLDTSSEARVKKKKKTHRNLDNIRSNQVQVLQTPQDGPQLPGRPATRLGGAGGGGKGRVEGVNVDGQVDGVLGADPLDDALDDVGGADGVDLAGLDDLEAAVAVVGVVRGPAQRRADAGVDVGVVVQQALHRGVVKVGAVVDGCDLGGGAAEHLGLPWFLWR